MLQKQKLKLAIYGLIIALVLISSAFVAYYFRAQSRDYQRLADLKVGQTALSDYFLRNGTYLVAGCQPGMELNGCLPINVKDPINSGDYRYLVVNLSDADYEIKFSLETGLGGLQKGVHILDKNGARR